MRLMIIKMRLGNKAFVRHEGRESSRLLKEVARELEPFEDLSGMAMSIQDSDGLSAGTVTVHHTHPTKVSKRGYQRFTQKGHY